MVALRLYGADPTRRGCERYVFSLIRESVCRGSIHPTGIIGYLGRDEYGPYRLLYAQRKIQNLMLKLVSLSIMYERRGKAYSHISWSDRLTLLNHAGSDEAQDRRSSTSSISTSSVSC